MKESIDKLQQAAAVLEASLQHVAEKSGIPGPAACHELLQQHQAVTQAMDTTTNEDAKKMLLKAQANVNYDLVNQQMAGHELVPAVQKEIDALAERIKAMVAALEATIEAK